MKKQFEQPKVDVEIFAVEDVITASSTVEYSRDINEVIETHKRASKNISTIYAVWSGSWRSDLFIIDDLDLFAEAVEIFSTTK